MSERILLGRSEMKRFMAIFSEAQTWKQETTWPACGDAEVIATKKKYGDCTHPKQDKDLNYYRVCQLDEGNCAILMAWSRADGSLRACEMLNPVSLSLRCMLREPLLVTFFYIIVASKRHWEICVHVRRS